MKKFATILACLLLLTACGSSDGIEKMNGQTAVKVKVVNIVIKDGKVTPQGQRVEVTVDQQVELHVTSDAEDEVHVHSEPEHEYEIPAGTKDKVLTLSLDTPGQVAVESHHLEVTIVQLVVRP